MKKKYLYLSVFVLFFISGFIFTPNAYADTFTGTTCLNGSASSLSQGQLCDRNETISGTVTGYNGSITITLSNISRGTKAAVLSNSVDGSFSFKNVVFAGANDLAGNPTVGDGYKVEITVPNFYVSSPIIYDTQLANGRLAPTGPVSDCAGSCNFTLTPTPTITKSNCQNSDSMGGADIQEINTGNILIQACKNWRTNIIPGTLGAAYVGNPSGGSTGNGIYITNNTNSQTGVTWDYKNYVCDGTGLARQGHLSCDDLDAGLTKGVISGSFSSGPIGQGQVVNIVDGISFFVKDLQSGPIARINGATAICGSAQVDLYNFRAGGQAIPGAVFWGYTDALDSCPPPAPGASPASSTPPGGRARIIDITACSGTLNNQTITWTADGIRGGNGIYNYSWTDTTANPNVVIAGGATNTTSLTDSVTKTYSTNGAKTASVTVTDTNTPPASSGTVSCGSVTVTGAGGANQPNLVVLSPILPTSATVGTAVTFSGTVKNTGSATANSSRARLKVDNTNQGTVQSVNSLLANQTYAVSFNSAWTPTASDATVNNGNHTFQICVDVVNNESDTTDNCTSGTITVSAIPVFDFTLSQPADLTLIQRGSAGVISSTITKNNNAAAAEAVTVGIDPSTPLPAGATSTTSNCTPANGNPCSVSISLNPGTARAGIYPNIRLKGTSNSQTTGRFSPVFTLTVSAAPGASPAPNAAPWIQTVGGDVHSNTGIDTPGGP